MQAAIDAVQDRDVLNEEVDYIVEGERLLLQRSAAQLEAPSQAAAAPPQSPQASSGPPRAAAAAAPPAAQGLPAQPGAAATSQPLPASPATPAAKVGWIATSQGYGSACTACAI